MSVFTSIICMYVYIYIHYRWVQTTAMVLLGKNNDNRFLKCFFIALSVLNNILKVSKIGPTESTYGPPYSPVEFSLNLKQISIK